MPVRQSSDNARAPRSSSSTTTPSSTVPAPPGYVGRAQLDFQFRESRTEPWAPLFFAVLIALLWLGLVVYGNEAKLASSYAAQAAVAGAQR